MSRLLLHITLILKSNVINDRVIISDYKPDGEILFYDNNHHLIPISIVNKINMNYINHGRVGFQCDYTIMVPNNNLFLPLNNDNKKQKICYSYAKHNPDYMGLKDFTIIYFKDGYELWLECPDSFLYQVTSADTINQGLQYQPSTQEYLNYKQRDWNFDVFCMSITDENLNTSYVQFF